MQPKEVPLGAVVFPCAPGEDKPDTEAALRLLLGGVPNRAKWYPCDPAGKNLHAGFEYGSIREGVRFVPAQAYTAENAPHDVELAVFVDNKCIKYERYPRNDLQVARLSDGTFISVCGYAYDHWLRRIMLPDNAVLVPHGDCKYDKSIDDAVVLPLMRKGCDVWRMLEEAGAAFRRGSSAGGSGSLDFCHVWLLLGWALLPGTKQFTGARSEKIVDGTGTTRACVIWVERYGKVSGAISLENAITVDGGENFSM